MDGFSGPSQIVISEKKTKNIASNVTVGTTKITSYVNLECQLDYIVILIYVVK